MAFTSGCCQGVCDSHGVPRAFAVYLNGYTDDTSNPSAPKYYSNLNNANGPAHTELGLLNSDPPAYVLYASGLSTGGSCTYDLLYGPAMYLDYEADPDDETAPRDVRVEISATIDVELGVPTLTVNVNGWSTFKLSLGTAPLDCTAIGSAAQLAVPLTTNGIGTYGANAACWVQALAPARDCPGGYSGCTQSGGSGGSGGSNTGGQNTKLRQPGTTTKCFANCGCCVCNALGAPPSFEVYFTWPAAGDDVCAEWDLNFGGSGPHKYDLPPKSVAGAAQCVYAVQTTILNWWLVLTIGFDGDPSQKGIWAKLEMASGFNATTGAASGTIYFTFEAEHLEFSWMEAVLGKHWAGPGTFPCSQLGNPSSIYLPLVVENMVDDQPCDIRDMRLVQCFIQAVGPFANPGTCCCDGDNAKQSTVEFLYVCFSSEDPNCPLSGVLAQLTKNGALSWQGTVLLDNGGTLTVNVAWGSGQWNVSWNCGGAGGNAQFPSLTSPAQSASAGSDCCSGNVTVALSKSPGACPGLLTAGEVGKCGCFAGEAPPDFLIVELPQMSDGHSLDQQPACWKPLILNCAGAYVVNYKGRTGAGCPDSPCGCLYATNYDLGGGSCLYLGVPPVLSFTVTLWDDGSIAVQAVTSGHAGGQANWSLPAAAQRQCAPLDVEVPFQSAALNWAYPSAPPIHVYSL